METESLKIISLQASNIKKLTAIEIVPDGNMVVLKGENGAGKSSVLDSIWYVLTGKRAFPERPIREGASKAECTVKLGNPPNVSLIARLRISAAGATLTLTDGSGAAKASPQAILDSLVGNLAFDPLAFSRMDAKKQLETVKALVGLDFSTQEAEKLSVYNQRTLVNRDLASSKSRWLAIPAVEGAPDKETTVAELATELLSKEEINRANASARTSLDALRGSHAILVANHETAKAALAAAQTKYDQSLKAIETSKTTGAAKKAEVALLVDVDTAELKERIANAESLNKKFRDAKARKELEAEIALHQKKSDELTAQIEAIDKFKDSQVSKAKFPLPEISFGDSAVLLNKLPFSQASTGEQLRASVAIGMALNPKLRVIFIRDGSLLDAKNLAVISSMAEKNNYQVWLETVTSTEPSAIEIVDGHIKE